MITYIIADDHKIFRQGLKLILADDQQLQCVGEAANGAELIDMLAGTKADVVLLDLKMPVMDGMTTLKSLKEDYPDLKVVVLTMYDDEHFVLHMIEAGANGYLLKNAEPEEIKTAVKSAYETGYYFNDLVNTTLLKQVVQQKQNALRFKQDIQLNDRELEVLRLICQEYTAAEIAGKIFLSSRTVEGIRSSLLEKIGVRNTAGLVMYAARNKLVS
jgi:DNA-binding NarL/FixJ family response regulator